MRLWEFVPTVNYDPKNSRFLNNITLYKLDNRDSKWEVENL